MSSNLKDMYIHQNVEGKKTGESGINWWLEIKIQNPSGLKRSRMQTSHAVRNFWFINWTERRFYLAHQGEGESKMKNSRCERKWFNRDTNEVAKWIYPQQKIPQVPTKSARTVCAKRRVFPDALTQVSLSCLFLADKMHGTFIEHRNLQHFGAQTAFGLTTLRQRLWQTKCGI